MGVLLLPSIKQLQYFCALAKKKNMTSLSSELYVSQTALSNSISRLEAEVGVQLFDRIGRNLFLNEYGAAYLEYIEDAFSSLDKASNIIQDLKNKNTNNVSISLNSPLLYEDIFASFINKHPGYTLTQCECNISSISDKLPKLETDLIIAGSSDFDSTSLQSHTLSKDRLWIFVPPSHRLANRKSVQIEELKNEKFICQSPHTGFSRFCKKLFNEINFTPQIIAECDYSMRKILFHQNIGIILATDANIRANYYNYGHSILLKGIDVTRDMSIFWSKNNELSEAAKLFRNHVIEYYNNLQTQSP